MTEATSPASVSARLELRVADADLDAFASLFERLTTSGITFTTLSERRQTDSRWLEHFTHLDNETRNAWPDPNVPRTVQSMEARLSNLAMDFDACFIALEREHWVGYSCLDTANSSAERLRQSWTGVLPSHRRRGIATALKVLGVAYAREHGYAFIETTSRSDNVVSQAMNLRVGFRVSTADLAGSALAQRQAR